MKTVLTPPKAFQSLLLNSNINLNMQQLFEKFATQLASEQNLVSYLKNKTNGRENGGYLNQSNLKIVSALLPNYRVKIIEKDLMDEKNKLFKVELINALQIAKIMKINDPSINQQVKDKTVVIDVNQNKTELYQHGVKYLKNTLAFLNQKPHTTSYEQQLSNLKHQLYLVKNNAKIAALKKINNNLAYTKNITQYLQTIKDLEALNFSRKDIHIFYLESMPYKSTPSSPNKLCIILLGFILGLIISIFYVLIRHSYHKFNDEKINSSTF
ncbi:MAG: hypothetical protein PSV35_01430 [bacterium]|nr:hypothetical protein [bacterium]